MGVIILDVILTNPATMKIAIAVLCVLPLVLCAPQKKFIESLASIGSAFSLDVLKCDMQLMLDALGSDPSETACEDECHKLLAAGHVFQNLLHMLHIAPGDSQCNNMVATTPAA